MPEGRMAAVLNSYLSPLQHQFPYDVDTDDDSTSGGEDQEEEKVFFDHNLQQQEEESRFHFNVPGEAAKSTESLNTLLMSLPDIVIPDLVRNPLPLQCLAANALPESIRMDINKVLEEYSSGLTNSPGRRVQSCSSVDGGAECICSAAESCHGDMSTESSRSGGDVCSEDFSHGNAEVSELVSE